MVVSREVQHSFSLHPLPADHSVLEGFCQGMTHMQGSSHIWRWYWNDEVSSLFHLSIWAKLRLEQVALLPPLVSTGLDNLGVIGVGRLVFLYLWLLLCSFRRGGCCRRLFRSLFGKFLQLLSLLSFLFNYTEAFESETVSEVYTTSHHIRNMPHTFSFRLLLSTLRS